MIEGGFDKWMLLKEHDISTSEYFKKNGIKRIAVYGLGMLGTHFVTDLKESEIVIEYGIDGKGDAIKETFPVFTVNDDLPEVQLVVITATYDYVNIKRVLTEKGISRVISLDTVVGDLVENMR